MLLAPAAALPASLLKPPLPKPVVDPLPVVPGLEFEGAAVAAAPPAALPAPPAPCAKAAELERINAVAKPIAVSFIGHSRFLSAISDKRLTRLAFQHVAVMPRRPPDRPRSLQNQSAICPLAFLPRDRVQLLLVLFCCRRGHVVACAAPLNRAGHSRKKLLKASAFRSQVGRSRCSGETPVFQQRQGLVVPMSGCVQIFVSLV